MGSATTQQRYKEATEKGYLVYKSSSSERKLCSSFWNWCTEHDRPQVRVRTAKKSATVEMDLFSVRRIDQESKEYRFFCWDLEQTIEKFFPEYFPKKSSFHPGYFTYVVNVPLDQAEDLAKAMIATYSKHFGEKGI
jgi:hypothetical protein